MQFRNFKMVDYVVYGRGCFNQLDEIIAPHRKAEAPMIFLVDHFLKANHWQAVCRCVEKIKSFLLMLPTNPKQRMLMHWPINSRKNMER